MARYSVNPVVDQSDRPGPALGARDLLATARRSYTARDFDEAVRCAEDLLDLAVWEHDPTAVGALASAIPFLDSIFSARVGPRNATVALGAPTDSVKKRLSLPALELLARIRRPTSIHDVIAESPIPNRDCVRLLAGLLRRKVLVVQRKGEAP
jgi:hypothetical protein